MCFCPGRLASFLVWNGSCSSLLKPDLCWGYVLSSVISRTSTSSVWKSSTLVDVSSALFLLVTTYTELRHPCFWREKDCLILQNPSATHLMAPHILRWRFDKASCGGTPIWSRPTSRLLSRVCEILGAWEVAPRPARKGATPALGPLLKWIGCFQITVRPPRRPIVSI